MKKQIHFSRWLALLLLLIGSSHAMAQYPQTGDHTVCINSVEPYGVVLTPGSTYAWSITPISQSWMVLLEKIQLELSWPSIYIPQPLFRTVLL